MKTLKRIILICCVASTIFSCTKENISQAPEPQNSTQYFFNGEAISKEEIDESQNLIYLHNEPNVINVFDSNKKYESYLLYTANNLDKKDPQKDLLLNAIKTNKIAAKIAKIANQKNITKSSELPQEITELFNDLERIQNQTKLVTNVRLFEEIAYGGRSGTFPTRVLKLKKSWRNKASSLRFTKFGVITLCDKTFFRGTKKVIPSGYPAPFQEFPSLLSINFNDRLESFF